MPDTMTADQRKLILDIMSKASSMTVATVRPDGFPQATTVSYVNEGLTLYFGTWERAQKIQNLSNCNKVSATIGGPEDDWHKVQAISLGGLAELIRDAGELVRLYRLIAEKYPQTSDFASPDLGGAVLVRIKPIVISLLDYTKGFHHAELVKV
jgi:general stress protein 26